MRFKNNDDYESYINAIDQDYESEDSIFNVYIYKLTTPQFNKVNRSHYGNGCDFKHQIIEYNGKNCYIPITVIVLSNVTFFYLEMIIKNNI